MKEFTDQQVLDLIKLKYGKQVGSANNISYVSNKILGKVFGVSGSKIRQLYMSYFEKIKRKEQSLMERLQHSARQVPRQRYGFRFLRDHHIKWLTSSETLRK